ncbi:TatD family hydrolase [Salinisphaera sp. Q1T1-3]|uniref:TatD family hydrolase n=1 Tax=Salinisphaera sp. Q1T1-3 TaxID=2321229 RepID=UPI000E758CBE|nr:TatD family hydrolase [Salinisphaera sp. Q1T1-3]RJS94662.1 hydrolase TatD [Salinisphaera sp. Q1T1-3]
MALIDIGANLAHDGFDDDREAVMARAEAAGVTHCVVTGSDRESNARASALAEADPQHLSATAGLHPHHAEDWNTEIAAEMRDLAARNRLVAIGETGLDYFRDISPRDVQKRVFAEQLAMAVDTGLPMFLHQREAHDDFHAILAEHLPDLSRAVVHCFTDSAAALDDYLALGCHIGITGWICDERRGRALFDAVPAIPDDRLLIETDCPYLLPRTIRPKPRSRRNEPAYLPWVRDRVADARNQAPEHVEHVTQANAARFFALPDRLVS